MTPARKNLFLLGLIAVMLAMLSMPLPSIASAATPAELGYILPAEWEPHAAT